MKKRDTQTPAIEAADAEFAHRVGRQAARKLEARLHPETGVWFGLGMMGLVGWSVVVPTLAGAVIGAWLDRHFAGSHSWALAFMAAGLVLGCANAWRWVASQDRDMHARLQDNEGDAE